MREKIERIIKKDNLEKHATLCTRHRTETKNSKTEDKKGERHGHHKKTQHKLSTREGKAVSISYKTPVVLPIVKYGKGLVGDRGKIKIYI